MPIIDLSYSIHGATEIPVDHGYPLFSSIVRYIPALHSNREIGIHPIYGSTSVDGFMQLSSKSLLRIRIDTEKIHLFLPLAGKILKLNDKNVIVGVPRIYCLVPAANLQARMVTIKGFFKEPAEFQEALERQLKNLQINPQEVMVGKRRILRIQNKCVVGFHVRLLGLSSEESLRIQEQGLGGRRRFGCGIFTKMKETRR